MVKIRENALHIYSSLNQHTQAALLNQLAVSVELPSGYLAVRYGIDGPFKFDDFPRKLQGNFMDFPVRYVE
jgi:hypothetical protein